MPCLYLRFGNLHFSHMLRITADIITKVKTVYGPLAGIIPDLVLSICINWHNGLIFACVHILSQYGHVHKPPLTRCFIHDAKGNILVIWVFVVFNHGIIHIQSAALFKILIKMSLIETSRSFKHFILFSHSENLLF